MTEEQRRSDDAGRRVRSVFKRLKLLSQSQRDKFVELGEPSCPPGPQRPTVRIVYDTTSLETDPTEEANAELETAP
jgi:hypothetical protein